MWLMGCLMAPTGVLLGYRGPGALLLGFVMVACLAHLACASDVPVVESGDGPPSPEQRRLRRLRIGAACPAAFAMSGTMMFFCSGHFCEFSGLQYTSPFIGFDDMEW